MNLKQLVFPESKEVSKEWRCEQRKGGDISEAHRSQLEGLSPIDNKIIGNNE